MLGRYFTWWKRQVRQTLETPAKLYEGTANYAKEVVTDEREQRLNQLLVDTVPLFKGFCHYRVDDNNRGDALVALTRDHLFIVWKEWFNPTGDAVIRRDKCSSVRSSASVLGYVVTITTIDEQEHVLSGFDKEQAVAFKRLLNAGT